MVRPWMKELKMRASGVVLLTSVLRVSVAAAQVVAPNQFGILDRANAAKQLIVLATQQGISSLPPTSGQSFTYKFQPDIAEFVPSERLGPISFRAPQTVGKGVFSTRIAASYFSLGDTLGPILYAGTNPGGFTQFGLQASAKVGLLNFGFDYGLTNRLQLTTNFPVVINDAHASELYVTPTQLCPNNGPPCPVAGAATGQELNNGLASNALRIQKTSFTNAELLRINPALNGQFNSGTNAGLGRIDVGAKYIFFATERVQTAFMTEFFVPSPSEDQFAGSYSSSILPRLVGAVDVRDNLRGHADVGYEHDFNVAELRRFTWNVGASVPLTDVTFDFGFGGSVFNEGVQWTPSTASYLTVQGQPGSITALQGTRLGDNFVDFLGGVKVRLNRISVIAGSVNVPINNEGFRAPAVGTLALELYF